VALNFANVAGMVVAFALFFYLPASSSRSWRCC
jgi:hypothetical protein